MHTKTEQYDKRVRNPGKNFIGNYIFKLHGTLYSNLSLIDKYINEEI